MHRFAVEKVSGITVVVFEDYVRAWIGDPAGSPTLHWIIEYVVYLNNAVGRVKTFQTRGITKRVSRPFDVDFAGTVFELSVDGASAFVIQGNVVY